MFKMSLQASALLKKVCVPSKYMILFSNFFYFDISNNLDNLYSQGTLSGSDQQSSKEGSNNSYNQFCRDTQSWLQQDTQDIFAAPTLATLDTSEDDDIVSSFSKFNQLMDKLKDTKMSDLSDFDDQDHHHQVHQYEHHRHPVHVEDHHSSRREDQNTNTSSDSSSSSSGRNCQV